MGSPYLNNNENILLSTHNVVINTISAEAILTNQRLMLVDARHTQLRPQDIPFEAIETVTIGENTAMDPVLSLSVVLPDQTRHTLGIVFPQDPKTRRAGERDAWATRLKELSVTAQKDNGLRPAELLPPWVAGSLPEEEGAEQKQGEETVYHPPLASRRMKTKPAAGRNKTVAVAVFAIVVILIAAAGVYFFAPSLIGKSVAPAPVTPAVTMATEETQIPVESPTAEITPEPVATPQATATEPPVLSVTVPQTGIWVKIEYTGNYTASFGTAGRMRDIAGSGEQVYQVPARNAIIDATASKLDESGTPITVSIYTDGQLAKSSVTTSPHGTAEVHADLRTPATATTAAVTTAPAS